MGVYDNEVRSHFGQSAWDILEKHVSNGVIDPEKMQDIAQKLAPAVGGNHLRRMQRQGMPNWFEFREVLSDWYKSEPEKFEEGSTEALETLAGIVVSADVALPNVAKELRDCVPPKRSPCCSHLRAMKLSPESSAPDNLDSLCEIFSGQIAGSNGCGDKSFDEAKSCFIKENYPNLRTGVHAHPDIFIQESLDFNESVDGTDQETRAAKMFDFLQSQFKSHNCFIFQNFDTCVDQKVVKDFCRQLTRDLDSGLAKVEKIEEQLRMISRLVFLDWNSIKRESNHKDGSLSACKERIALLQSHSKKHNAAKGFLVVNLNLSVIIYVDMDPENVTNCTDKLNLIKRYLEGLLVPDKEIDWRLIGFEIPEKNRHSLRCEQCSKHVLDIDTPNQDFSALIEKLHREEKVGITSQSRRELRSQRPLEEKRRDSYADLVSNIVVLANMDLIPHCHAVGKVMKQLNGTADVVIGPAIPAANEDLIQNKKIIWNREQMKLLFSRSKKIILQSDFGCGKSLMLHRMIQGNIEAEHKTNFVISFLPQKKPYVRSVLDVANRLHYKAAEAKGTAKVISVADIMASMDASEHLSQEAQMDICFQYLSDLTKNHEHANLVVDEVPLEALVKREKIHDECFKGSLWLAVLSMSKYDFRDQNDNRDLSHIPAVENQKFKLEYLKTNMRNGDKIIKGSLSLQDGIIEDGAISIISTTQRETPSAPATPSASPSVSASADPLESATSPASASSSVSASLSASVFTSNSAPKSGGGMSKGQGRVKNSDVVMLRRVESGRSGLFVGPKDGARGCLTFVGMEPRQLKSGMIERFLKSELPSRLEHEVFVILGNVEEDIDWLYSQIADADRAQLTLYNPKGKTDVNDHERAPELFLQRQRGGLVTLGNLFNGMESARVIFIYENPYASHFRANYLRASVELILIDRNSHGIETVEQLQQLSEHKKSNNQT